MDSTEPGMHFECIADVYARARPPYPDALYERLVEFAVLGPDARVLEIGAGAGLATSRLIQAGARVTAVEPGPELARHLARRVPHADVIVDTFENACASGELRSGAFDSVCVATAFHWLDRETGLPSIHRVLAPGGRVAVWRHVFGDPSESTPFRDKVAEIVARRPASPEAEKRHEAQFDWIADLTQKDLFDVIHAEHWRWSVELTSTQVHDLFSTFSDWQPREVDELASAADELGGSVTEHYGTTLAIAASAVSAHADQ